ncbi:MAG: Cof-type HAD-IIB family hydrolase [Chloroflexi bacterium]|nr:Cof-type HAD-IIB family hydrolase [Chloroflexota bacterium]
MGYRLIALDIDGTIRSQDHPLSERTRQAVARVRGAGATITLATGRIFNSAARSSADLDITNPIATSQGSHIADPVTGDVLWHQPLTSDMVLAALDALADPADSGMEVVAYGQNEVYVSKLTDWAAAYGQRNNVKVNVVGDLSAVADQELTRLVVVGDDDGIRDLEASLQGRFESSLHVTRSLPHFCEILHPLGGKDKAMQWLCDYHGIGYDQTIAFGNGYNDVRMLAWANLGVALGDAVPEALAVANRVSPPMAEDGVARVLEDLLDQGLIG